MHNFKNPTKLNVFHPFMGLSLINNAISVYLDFFFISNLKRLWSSNLWSFTIILCQWFRFLICSSTSNIALDFKSLMVDMIWSNVMECLCHKWPWICSVWHSHNSIHDLFSYYHIFNRNCLYYWRSWHLIFSGVQVTQTGVDPWFFGGVQVTQSLVFCIVFFLPLIIFLSLFCWQYNCQSFDLLLLISLLVYLNFS